MSWIRYDARTPWSPKIIDLPSDGARWASVVVLCAAKQQVPSGEWANERHFRACVGPSARYLKALLATGLLERDGDRILVHDWRDYQSDPTGSDRQRRRRSAPVTVLSRDGHGAVTELSRDSHAKTGRDSTGQYVTPPSVPPSVDVEPSLAAYMAAGGNVRSARAMAWLERLAQTHGEEATARMVGRQHALGVAPNLLLGAVEEQLVLDGKRAERAERADEERRLREKRAPVAVLTEAPAPELSPEEIDRQVREYRATHPVGAA